MRHLFGTARRRGLTLLAMIILVFGGSMATAAPAMASTPSSIMTSADYFINEGTTCQNQYGGPQYFAMNVYGGPYGWTCYYRTYGIPLAVSATPVGGLNFQKFYCDRYYSGSHATLVYNNTNGWRCRFGNGGW